MVCDCNDTFIKKDKTGAQGAQAATRCDRSALIDQAQHLNRLQELVAENSPIPFILDSPHCDHQDSRHRSSSTKIPKPPFYL
jgi:hypothetical protein